VYSEAKNLGFNLEVIPNEDSMFMEALLGDIESGDFYFDFLLAAFAFLFWIRLLLMLKLTSTFGPLI
jgi:hypothetical protein